jgi:glycosyltransferase involved in cell wall biosynthesis
MADLGPELRSSGLRVQYALPAGAVGLHERARRAGFATSTLADSPAARIWHLQLGDTFDRGALGWLLLGRRRAGRTILTEHLARTDASDPELALRPPRPGAAQTKRRFKRAEFGLADSVIAVSAGSGRFLEHRYGLTAPKLLVIPNGVARAEASTGPAAASTEPRILMIGSLIAQKGIDDLLCAAGLATRDWTVEIWGDGPHRQRLEARAGPLVTSTGRPRVTFRGWSDEVNAELRCADLLVVPSRWEASSYTALDAMSFGVAVVATRVDGVEDIVSDRHTGRLLAPGDPRALADAIDDLIADREQLMNMGAAGVTRARSDFSLTAMANRTIAAYELSNPKPERGVRSPR